MTGTLAARVGRSAPPSPGATVVFVDTHMWEAFAALAGALRQHGVRVVRVTVPPRGSVARVAARADGLLFERTLHAVSGSGNGWSVDPGIAGRVPGVVVDVHAHDDLVAPLDAALPRWRTSARRVSGDADPAVLGDKLAMHRFAAGAGVPVPRAWDRPEAVEFPVMVKARAGFAGVGVRRADDPDALAAAWRDLTALPGPGVFAEECLVAGGLMTAGVALAGRLLAEVAMVGRPHPGDPRGPSARVRVVDHPEALAHTRRLVAALGYTGFLNLDWVSGTDGRPRLIDVNARVFGAWPALQEAGVDLLGPYLQVIAATGAPSWPPMAGRRDDGDHGLLAFPCPRADSVGGIARWAVESSGIVRERRAWLGPRWARASRVKIAGGAVQALARRASAAGPAAATRQA